MTILEIRRPVAVPLLAAAAAVLLVSQKPWVAQVLLAVRTTPHGSSRWRAAEVAIGRRWSPRAARWVLREPRLMWSTVLLLRGRRDGVPAARGFSCHRDVMPVWLALGVVAAFEVVVTSLLPLPAAVHALLLLLGAWGLLVVAELAAALIVHPHLVSPSEVRVRYGFWDEIVLSRDSIAAVVPTRPRATQRGLRFAERSASLAPNGITNVEFTLDPSAWLCGQEVQHVQCWADDPASFIAAARP